MLGEFFAPTMAAAAATKDLLEEPALQAMNVPPTVKMRTMRGKDDIDIETTILYEIRRLKKARKRANSQSVVERLVGRMGLPSSEVSMKMNELIQCGKILTGMIRGKESFKLPNEQNDKDSDTSSDSDESESNSHRSEDMNLTFSEKSYRSDSIVPTIDTPSKPPAQAHTAASVTLPVSIINDLTKNANLANEMLLKERQMVLELLKENTELKLKIKDLEVAARPDSHGHQTITSIPPMNTISEESCKKNDPTPPVGDTNKEKKEKQENTKQVNKKSKVNNRNANKNQATTRNHSKMDKNWKRSNTNIGETKETVTRKVLIMGDSQLRKINGEKLSRDHHSVDVKVMPGAKIEKTRNVDIKEDVDIIIVHAGTCNIRKQTIPDDLAEGIVSTLRDVKSKLPKAQIAFSSILKRKDDLELNAIVIKTNQLLEEKLLLSGLDFINNENIRYGNISFDGLHINEGGVKVLASNYSKYIRYC